jgi:chemotaxis signal transduction protein
VSGFLTFVMAGRELAAPLAQVREVVRATGVQPLRGVRAPVTGLVELRGSPLPVVDLRSDPDAGTTGDVVVLPGGPEGALGVAVDRVLAVVAGDELAGDDAPLPYGLPGYVTGLLRSVDDRRTVFLVDLWVLAGVPPSVPARPAPR